MSSSNFDHSHSTKVAKDVNNLIKPINLGSNLNTADIKFINHMIPHHQEAINSATELLKKTNNETLYNLAIKIIQTQSQEIEILKNLLNNNNLQKPYY